MEQFRTLRAAASPVEVTPDTPWDWVLAPHNSSPSNSVASQAEWAHLLDALGGAVQVAFRCIDVILVGQRGAQVPVDDAFAQSGDALFQTLEHAPGQVLLEGFNLPGAGRVWNPPIWRRAHNLQRRKPRRWVSAVHLGGVFQGGAGQEHHLGSVGVQCMISQAMLIVAFQVCIGVIPVVARIQSGSRRSMSVAKNRLRAEVEYSIFSCLPSI